MLKLKGKSAFEGICIGEIKIIKHVEPLIIKKNIENVDQEIKKFENAKKIALQKLDEIYNKALKEVGEQYAEIFQVHKMMTEDVEFNDEILNNIKDEKINADYAVEQAGYKFSQIFVQMDDDYMKARAVDIIDVSKRIVNILCGINDDDVNFTKDVILVSSDITPSDIMKLDKSKILGFVTTFGSVTSHAAILARTMSLPTVVDTKTSIEKKYEGKIAIIDGIEGKVFIDPDAKLIKEYESKRENEKEATFNRKKLIGKPNKTKDGKEIEIFCNIGSANDIKIVLENDGGGIGLFRSEFIYLESNDYPSEEKQFGIYKSVLEQMQGKKVVIRTMDIGADKKVGYFNLEPEDNPALGYRSIRICLDRPQILKTQFRALYRASVYGNLSVMIPMITSLDEINFVKKIAKESKDELKKEKIPYNENVSIGIMIETPAAALISDQLAEQVDFFSVGTNDLVQYTLAVDRQNSNLDKVYNPHHRAVLKLIKLSADNIHKHKGKWIGICGELARDMDLIEFFFGIGIDELSMSPPYVLRVREKISTIDTTKFNLKKYI